MAGAAFDFAWRDENVAAAVTYSEFKTLALKRFDTEPMSSKTEKFWNAKQNAALEPVSDELEVSVMQWQVDMLANDEYGRESGVEVSLSVETPQMPTPKEKGSERDEVGEKPREVMSESVAEIAPCEDEVPGTNPLTILTGPPRKHPAIWRRRLLPTGTAAARQPTYAPPLYGRGVAERLLFVPSMRPARMDIPSNSAAPGLISAPSVDGHLRRSREKKRCLLMVKEEDGELQSCGLA
ncbi:hypothetical protein HPB50_017939 [Hyalomma asiaticum]|uniref:Uncharacterized protein n=1 Tax=Hyalomma asiaticum TaxID=266040 RepID=A0ACB7T5M9_HYAAI|nr:hypothetical protein HPB50_017939 [Hyalomma asiaticum]